MITSQGKHQLEIQLTELKAELVRTLDERAKAASEGDLKENSAYIFYGERAEVLRSQIRQIQTDLASAKVQSAPTQTSQIEFGHRVRLRFETDNREMSIVLVGKNDAALKSDWISCESPLGIALLGKHQGSRVEVNGQMVSILDITTENI